MPEPHVKRTGPRTVGGDGEIEIFCADEQSDCSIDAARWRQLAEDILRTQGVRGSVELTLMFVPESTIAGLNEQYMNKLGSTDVLAFPLDAVFLSDSPMVMHAASRYERSGLPDSGGVGVPTAIIIIRELPAAAARSVVAVKLPLSTTSFTNSLMPGSINGAFPS